MSGHNDERFSAEVVIPKLNRLFSDGLVVIANIGLHLSKEKIFVQFPGYFNRRIASFLNYLHDLRLENKVGFIDNIVLLTLTSLFNLLFLKCV